MFALKGVTVFVINLAIEIFCDGNDEYPCKKGNSYAFIAKRNLSQIENFQVAIHESITHGWTTRNYQSHHCPECSSETNFLSSEDSIDSKNDNYLN